MPHENNNIYNRDVFNNDVWIFWMRDIISNTEPTISSNWSSNYIIHVFENWNSLFHLVELHKLSTSVICFQISFYEENTIFWMIVFTELVVLLFHSDWRHYELDQILNSNDQHITADIACEWSQSPTNMAWFPGIRYRSFVDQDRHYRLHLTI